MKNYSQKPQTPQSLKDSHILGGVFEMNVSIVVGEALPEKKRVWQNSKSQLLSTTEKTLQNL
jgi:hypothetical protein